MTAEIAILNRNAVVLATDSAITSLVSSDSLGQIPKISHSANKLFALSTSDPLAVMIYNDSTFGPVPWETIIKEFRKNVERQSTVEEYANQFIEYLEQFKDYISDNQSVQLIVKTRDKVIGELHKALIESRPDQAPEDWDTASVQEFLVNQCELRIENIHNSHDQATLNGERIRSEVEATVSNWNDHLKNEFNVQLDDRTSDLLMKLVIETLKVVPLSESYTGIVVAGFGEHQHFPALSHYIVDNVLCGEVKIFLKRNISVQADGVGHVVPFAQQAVPTAFLGGLSSEHWEAIYGSMSHVIELLYGYLLEELIDDLSEERFTALQNSMEEVRTRLLKFLEHSLAQGFDIKDADEMSRIVDYLTKEDIAELAEALVHLTQLKLKVSREPETVGGPIDVAVISKGDGLIWIKRKHYFQQELNPRYFNRLRQED